MKVRRLLAAPLRALEIDRYGRRPLGDGEFDAIVVPGCLVFADGRPSGALVRRVELGVRLWREGRAPVLALSGRGRGGRTEAEVMRELALSSGVPDGAIAVEQRSMSTYENARFSFELLGVRAVLVGTDSSHVLRCEREFSRWFERADATGTPLAGRSRVRMALREALREAWLGRDPAW